MYIYIYIYILYLPFRMEDAVLLSKVDTVSIDSGFCSADLRGNHARLRSELLPEGIAPI